MKLIEKNLSIDYWNSLRNQSIIPSIDEKLGLSQFSIITEYTNCNPTTQRIKPKIRKIKATTESIFPSIKRAPKKKNTTELIIIKSYRLQTCKPQQETDMIYNQENKAKLN